MHVLLEVGVLSELRTQSPLSPLLLLIEVISGGWSPPHSIYGLLHGEEIIALLAVRGIWSEILMTWTIFPSVGPILVRIMLCRIPL